MAYCILKAFKNFSPFYSTISMIPNSDFSTFPPCTPCPPLVPPPAPLCPCFFVRNSNVRETLILFQEAKDAGLMAANWLSNFCHQHTISGTRLRQQLYSTVLALSHHFLHIIWYFEMGQNYLEIDQNSSLYILPSVALNTLTSHKN